MNFREGCFQGLLGSLLVMVGLQIQPHLGWPSEVAFEPEGGIHGEGTLTFHDFIDPARWHTDVLGNAVFRNAERNQEFLTKDFSRMDGGVCFHGSGSVVVDDFNVVRPIGFPAETDAPLLVDADRMKALSFTLESFQQVARWNRQMIDFGDGMELRESFLSATRWIVGGNCLVFRSAKKDALFLQAKEQIMRRYG